MDYVYWVIDKQLAGRPGPQRAPWDLTELYEAGFRAVVSLARDVPVPDLESYGFAHYRADLPPLLLISPGLQRAFLHEVLPIWDFIDEQLEANHPTLVHCHAGNDRTGAVLAGYLVVTQAMKPENAIAYVRARNPHAMEAEGYEDAVRLLTSGERPDPRTLL
jgi:hypothetical protein